MAQSNDDASFLGRGWAFPPTFNGTTNRLTMNQAQTNINQSIDVILNTVRGSRSVMPQFGSDLSSYVFGTINQELKGNIVQSVKTALLQYEPRIRVNDVTLNVVDDLNPVVEVNVSYTVITTNSRHNHVYPFSLTEANNLNINTGGL